MSKNIRFSPKDLEMVRAHSWNGKYKELLHDALRLKPNQRVVDVGCGTGAFTRILAERLDAKKGGQILGIDRDAKLIAVARRIASEQGLTSLVRFKRGQAQAIPLPDDYADRVVCQALLWLMTESERTNALKEMIRVCRKGGIIAAVEGAIDTSTGWFPGDARLTELYRKRTMAELMGYKRLYGYDRSIGYKLPSLFKRIGLTQVRLDGITDARLRSDDRVPIDYKREVVKQWYFLYPTQLLSRVKKAKGEEGIRAAVEKSEPILVVGGMSWREVVEYAKLRLAYYAKVADSPAILEDTTVEAGIHFITTGVKG